MKSWPLLAAIGALAENAALLKATVQGVDREPVNDAAQMFAHAIRCAATRGTDARSLGCATDLAHPGLEDCSGWQRRMTADD